MDYDVITYFIIIPIPTYFGMLKDFQYGNYMSEMHSCRDIKLQTQVFELSTDIIKEAINTKKLMCALRNVLRVHQHSPLFVALIIQDKSKT